MKQLLIVALVLTIATVTLAQSSAICKCGSTDISYSCCKSTDYCSTSLYYHCD